MMSGNHGNVVADSVNIAKPHQRGEEEHGERCQFQHLSETREFSGEAFWSPEREGV
jgi:hypothetical protein